ncbi:hypothetical protein FOZ61_002869, partial [Perkinsus olseni]
LKDGNDELTVRVRVLKAMAQTKEDALVAIEEAAELWSQGVTPWRFRWCITTWQDDGRLPVSSTRAKEDAERQMRAMRQMLAKYSAVAREANQVYGDCHTRNESLPPQIAECRRPKDEEYASVPSDDEANKRARCSVVEVVDLRNA